MIYVTSDIHGNYDRYIRLLDKIKLGEKDALVILGDIVDRGEQSMEIILDIIKRDNVFSILGNHDEMALASLKALQQEITEESIRNLGEDTTNMLTEWLFNLGGEVTMKGFTKLSDVEKESVIEFLEDLPLYEEFVINNQKYLLVHGSLENFHPVKDISDYTADQLIWGRMDYEYVYFADCIIVSGHTPTALI